MRRVAQSYKEFFGVGEERTRQHPRDFEHRLQCSCVQWFRLAYPERRHNLFAVPNGGFRTKTTAAKMKAEGVLPGVADLLLLYAAHGYHGLCIELKTTEGRQAYTQGEWQRNIEADGYLYVVVRSIEEFIEVVTAYLSRNGNVRKWQKQE